VAAHTVTCVRMTYDDADRALSVADGSNLASGVLRSLQVLPPLLHGRERAAASMHVAASAPRRACMWLRLHACFAATAAVAPLARLHDFSLHAAPHSHSQGARASPWQHAALLYERAGARCRPRSCSMHRSHRALASLMHRSCIAAVQALHRLAQLRTKLREAAGAAPIYNMNCQMYVDDVESSEPTISVQPVAVHESHARTAVMEMMVLAGEVAAKWAHQKRVPMLFRCAGACPRAAPLEPVRVVTTSIAGLQPCLPHKIKRVCRLFRQQEAPSPPTDAQLARLSHSRLAQSYLWRTRMLKSGTTADSPGKHHGLGLDAYSQVTSPIRRYAPHGRLLLQCCSE
jgi:RNB domain